ncbi:cyclic nucleotide-binding domain-containing protein [Sphingomonas aurantiaca]|uniref:cyclic nucleotide-binding domain-containing protein n=1 Tax=Sphingomonas aurantiaca TaxID=185949 RepID=UPI002FE271D7
MALPYTLRVYEPSSYLVREGDAPEQCAVLLSGFAYRQKQTGSGMRQIVSLHIPGEPLDFQHLFLDVADHNVQTLTRAEIATISRVALREPGAVSCLDRPCDLRQHAGRGIDLP